MANELWIDAKKRPKGWLSVSPSSLSDFLECARCGHRRHHYHAWPRIKYPGLAGGLDRTLKRLSDMYRLDGKLPPLWGSVLPGRRLYHEAPRRLKWQCEDLLLNVTGEPDELVLEKNGELAIVDFKSKASPHREIYESYRMQLNFYGLLARKIPDYPKISKTGYLIFFSPEVQGTNLGWHVEIEQLDIRPAVALEFLKKCEPYLRSSATPPAAPGCEACAFLDGLPRLAAQNGWMKSG